jgi:hypothetical protein
LYRASENIAIEENTYSVFPGTPAFENDNKKSKGKRAQEAVLRDARDNN